MKRALIGAAAGFALCLGLVFAVDTARFVTNAPEASSVAVAAPLQPLSVDPSWIKSGTPEFANVQIFQSPDGRTTAGLWSCTGPTTFEWHFDVDETVQVLEGAVDIAYLGGAFTLHAGDSATFHGGTSATWTVPHYVKKAYTLHNPGPLGRLWRSAFPA